MTNSPFNPLSMPEKVRLGAISFVNTVPIYANYRPDDSVDLIYDVPTCLNAAILAGDLDISPVSSACYLRNQDKLCLLDDLSVSSAGAVESVIFISRKPLGPELLDFPVIAVPNDSETSVALLSHLLHEASGTDLTPWFRVYEAANYRDALAMHGNALVIGDNALMVQDAGITDGFHCYDLSTLWKERTGLPFVFAVWVARRAWVEQNPEALASVNAQLCAARESFYDSPVIFNAGLSLAQQRSALPLATLERYYRHCLTYGLDALHQESLALYGQVLLKLAENIYARDKTPA
jgi:chorismate dehydratase